MPLVDVTRLTDSQVYGLSFQMLEANASIETQNDNVKAFNQTRSVNQAAKEEAALFTLETFAAKIISDRADQAYAQLVQYKQQIAVELFNAATPELQAQVLALLEVPDVVT